MNKKRFFWKSLLPISLLFMACKDSNSVFTTPIPTTDENVCKTWSDFENNTTDNILLDYSYAGYKHGEVAPPEKDELIAQGYKIYDISQYGGVPNDGKSDREAFAKALVAAGANRTDKDGVIRFQAGNVKAIFYFPEGDWVLQDEGENNVRLDITMGAYLIKGAGRDKTSISMNVKNELENPTQAWSAPSMLNLTHYSGLKDLANITADAAQGTFKVEVNTTVGINVGDWVCLHLYNNDPTLISQEMAPYEALETMADIKNGIAVYDYHQIKSIDGSTITFYEPIMHKVESKWNWSLKKYNYYENVGVEDINFKGKALEGFVHHKDGYDGDYKPLNMNRLTNSWLRRLRFTSISEAATIGTSANCSAYDIIIDGQRGHSAIRSAGSSRIFIGKIKDLSAESGVTGKGSWHSCGVSKHSMGAVIWNVEWGNESCFESHATQPRATLIDCCKGAFIAGHQGGDLSQLPNHLNDLVIWNMEATNTQANNNGQFTFWDEKWMKILPPIIVGFHGVNLPFYAPSVRRIESQGKPVSPTSLYEAQLNKRLGSVPSWLMALK